MENRRDGGGARGEEALVRERTQYQQRARLAGTVVADQPEVRDFVECVVHPREQHVVRGDVFVNRRKCDVAVDEGLDVIQQLGLAAHLTDLRRSEEHTSELQSLIRKSYAVFCLQ